MRCLLFIANNSLHSALCEHPSPKACNKTIYSIECISIGLCSNAKVYTSSQLDEAINKWYS